MLTENQWNPLPFPFTEIATPGSLCPLEASGLLDRLLEDTAGYAGVLATACTAEADGDDIHFAARLLAEHLHATVALWRQWRAGEAATKAAPLVRTPAGGKVGTA